MILNLAVGTLTLGTFVVFALATFGPVVGAQPGLDLFGWHPVLMTLAFCCLMPLGRWSYYIDTAQGFDTDKTRKAELRVLHRGFMTTATVSVVLGYVAIIASHIPTGVFFGYDFHNQAWKEGRRVAHVYVGYAAILLMLVQAFMGYKKFEALKLGEKIFTFHGTLGKTVIILGAIDILLAIWFFKWDDDMKVLLAVLVMLTAAISVVRLQVVKPEPLLMVN